MSPLFKSPAAPASESFLGKHKVKICVGAAVVITGVALAILLWPAAFGISAAVITYGFFATLPTIAYKVALLVGGVLCIGGLGAVAAICTAKTPAIQLTADEPGAPFVKQDDYPIDLSDLETEKKYLYLDLLIRQNYHEKDLRVSRSNLAEIKMQQELERANLQMSKEGRRWWLRQFTPERLKTIMRSMRKKNLPITVANQNQDVGIAHAQGKRPEMQDAHIAASCSAILNGKLLHYKLFGVIDGHGRDGELTANFVRDQIQQEIERAILKHCKDGISDEGIRIALKEACVRVDIRNMLDNNPGGAVAVFTLKIGSKLYTANIGDSRAILKVGNRVIPLSVDAKPDDPRFEQSIETRGGFVVQQRGTMRVNGAIAPARAFGDFLEKGNTGQCVLSAHPKISMIDLAEYPCQNITLIQACDGIWDVLSSWDVGTLVNHDLAPNNNAKGIVGVALNYGSNDNCSALVAPLQTKDDPIPLSELTDTIPDADDLDA